MSEKTSQAGAKVTVACKLPHGLELRLFDMVEVQRFTSGGVRFTEKEARIRASAGVVIIHGNTVPHGVAPDCTIARKPGSPFHAGYAITPNVDKDFWEEWLKQNKDLDAVKNGLLFAVPSNNDAVVEAKSRTSVASGLEPLKQGKDPRAPQRIEKSDEKRDAA